MEWNILRLYATVNVSAVLLMFFIVFGILGVQVFAGRFYRCSDQDVEFRYQCEGSYYDAVTGDVTARTWSNSHLNFDNLFRQGRGGWKLEAKRTPYNNIV
jgi:hypothetical protein